MDENLVCSIQGVLVMTQYQSRARKDKEGKPTGQTYAGYVLFLKNPTDQYQPMAQFWLEAAQIHDEAFKKLLNSKVTLRCNLRFFKGNANISVTSIENAK